MSDSSARIIDVTIVLSLDKYELLSKRMEDKFRDSIDIADSAIVVELNNDERKPFEYYVAGVFIDSRPIHQEQQFELERRGRLQIKLSDVSTAYLAKAGHAVILSFNNITE